MKSAVFLFDRSGIMAGPWAAAGYSCFCFDLAAQPGHRNGINFVRADLTTPAAIRPAQDVAFVAAFPPCTHLAVSGARWFRGKGLRALAESITLFATAAEYCEATGAPYLIENPVSTISTYWRKPDHTFHPYHFTGYAPQDNYTKKTCLWTGGGFVMPPEFRDPALPPPDNRIHTAAPSPERAAIRSLTPQGFSEAVFHANHNIT